MQSNEYKHAYYWFSKLWNQLRKFENFVKLKNILHVESMAAFRESGLLLYAWLFDRVMVFRRWLDLYLYQ